MEIDINTLLKGKSTSIKNKEYLSTEAYVTPFLERMSKFTDNFICQAKLPDQITISKNGEIPEEDLTYNRVWIQAVLPDDFAVDNHSRVLGMVYGLDVRKPVVKFYTGALNHACLNLCIFNPSALICQDLEPEKAINYKAMMNLMEQTSDVAAILNRFKNTEIPYNEELINENLGQWIRNSLNASYDNGYGKVKLATSTAVDAYKLLYEDKDSPYYVQPGNSTDLFNVYNSFTELITNDGNKTNGAKDIMNKCEKTLLLNNILSI